MVGTLFNMVHCQRVAGTQVCHTQTSKKNKASQMVEKHVGQKETPPLPLENGTQRWSKCLDYCACVLFWHPANSAFKAARCHLHRTAAPYTFPAYVGTRIWWAFGWGTEIISAVLVIALKVLTIVWIVTPVMLRVTGSIYALKAFLLCEELSPENKGIKVLKGLKHITNGHATPSKGLQTCRLYGNRF